MARLRRAAFVAGLTFAGAVALKQLSDELCNELAEMQDQNIIDESNTREMKSIPVEDTDSPTEETVEVEEESLKEGYQMVNLEEEIYRIVTEEYGVDASLKSNVIDKEGVERFDDESTDEYRPTLQVTSSTRCIIQAGTESNITEETIEKFVSFRKSGYRRFFVVPEEDVEPVKDLVDEKDATITVCSPETLQDEL